MPEVRTSEQLRSNPELLADYKRWCDDPMTRLVLGIVENDAKPHFPNISLLKGDVALAMMGQQCGVHWSLERMVSLGTEPSADDQPTMDFGARSYLERLGINVQFDESGNPVRVTKEEG